MLLEKLVEENYEKFQVHIRFNSGSRNDRELTELLTIFKNIYQNQGANMQQMVKEILINLISLI